MSNKNPATRIVNIPTKFVPLLQKEMDEKGIFTFVELMNQILRNHYQQKGWTPDGEQPVQTKEPAAAKEIVRG